MFRFVVMISMLPIILSAQVNKVFWDGEYHPKTQLIPPQLQDTLRFLTVIPYLVDYRLYEKLPVVRDVSKNGIESKLIQLDSNYRTYPTNTKILTQLLKRKISENFWELVPLKFPKLDPEDSVIIRYEIKQLIRQLKDSCYTSYTLNERLSKHLSHLGSRYILLTDLYYLKETYFVKSHNGFVLTSVFLFDCETQKLVYYNYTQNTSYNAYWEMQNFCNDEWCSESSVLNVKQLLKPLVKEIRKLKKQGKIGK